MGYHERRLPAAATLTLDGVGYDVDAFGMDDGQSDDPTDAFRFLFQLGAGLMIYVYVIQAGGAAGHGHFFHTLWLKDCAVAEVDVEDRGPPARVSAPPFALPVIYPTVTIAGSAGARSFAILAQRCATPTTLGVEIDFTFAGGHLRWSRAAAWQLALDGAPARALRADERLRFA